jgi:hypothetical protein
MKHLQAFHDRENLFAFYFLQEFRTDGRRFPGVLFRRFGPFLDSKTLRYGIVLYSSLRCREGREIQVVYLQRFYRAIAEAIKQKSYAELAYGCYAACMYSVRIGAPLEEIMPHARALRDSAYQLLYGAILSSEETFLLWCICEKVLWHLCRRFLFFDSCTRKEDLDEFATLTESLLSLDRNWPGWMRDSFEDVRMKLRFIHVMITLERKGAMETQLLKTAISDRFFDTWGWKDQTDEFHDARALSTDKQIIRRLTGALWAKFVDLLQHVEDSWAPSDKILSTIHSILHIVKQRPAAGSTTVPLRLDRFVNTAIDAFVLIGLVLCEWQKDRLAIESSELTSLWSLSSETRNGLAYLVEDQMIKDSALLDVFDDTCWTRVLGLESVGCDEDPVSLISAWLRICRHQNDQILLFQNGNFGCGRI